MAFRSGILTPREEAAYMARRFDAKRKLDPDQLFVVSAIKRSGIAEALNEYLESLETTTERLKENDPRLTDEVCRAYADELGDIESRFEDLSNEEVEELTCNLDEKFLKLLGFPIES